MWWQALIPIVLEIVKKWLENRAPRATVGATGPAVPLMSDAEADDVASRLEQAVAKAPKAAAAGPVTHEGGVIAHVTDLIAALRAKDWVKIQTLLIDLLTHL